MHLALESPDQPAVIALIAELDAYQDELYPPESRHTVDIGTLAQPHVLFAVARDGNGVASGCAAIMIHTDFGELKRLYVHPRLRGQGMGRALIELLHAEAARRGCVLIRLETGPSQPEALGLYERMGYTRRGPFAAYTNDPLSVFMEKRLAPKLVRA